jgi:hypothetical protein
VAFSRQWYFCKKTILALDYFREHGRMRNLERLFGRAVEIMLTCKFNKCSTFSSDILFFKKLKLSLVSKHLAHSLRSCASGSKPLLSGHALA